MAWLTDFSVLIGVSGSLAAFIKHSLVQNVINN